MPYDRQNRSAGFRSASALRSITRNGGNHVAARQTHCIQICCQRLLGLRQLIQKFLLGLIGGIDHRGAEVFLRPFQRGGLQLDAVLIVSFLQLCAESLIVNDSLQVIRQL